MKKVYVHFYSAGNFGDDFFIKIISEYFEKVQFRLLINPKYRIQGLPSNVKIIYFSSWIITICNKLISIFKKGKIRSLLECCIKYREEMIKKNVDAIVYIGGSIFMEGREIGVEEKNFSVSKDVVRDYGIKCKVKKGHSKEFIIGANFGPYYSEEHLKSVTNIFSKKCNVCLRDYSSYELFEQLENVQYAPDVIFLHNPIISKSSKKKNVVISIIDPEKKGTDKVNIKCYYELMRETIEELNRSDYIINLVSFCDKEGDRYAIDRIVDLIEDKNNVRVHSYKGDIEEILSMFATTDFVIGARFHSIILGILYKKPTFPISYNCKTDNYLLDLEFPGKYARLDRLNEITLDDILYNKKNNIICSCEKHKKYAENQFYALKQFLMEEFD